MMMVESFTDEERRALAPYFTNTDTPVFALTNLPEVVKGALFARYSRSPKSLRRLFLDEFFDQVESARGESSVGVERADKLYERVFNEYGDDSVAQLGGAHIACEGASNILTKILEWGRLMAYLEQSTRYISYTDRVGGSWKYHVPSELPGDLARRYRECLDAAFDCYARWLAPMDEHYRRQYPNTARDSEAVYRRTLRAKSLDTLRGLLPAATRSNVGLFGTGQAFEALLLRMRSHPLAEARQYADWMLIELRKVIPAFLKRVDVAERGDRWSRYLRECADATALVGAELVAGIEAEAADEVTLVDFDPDGEAKVVAAALYAYSALPDRQLLQVARSMTPEQRLSVLRAYVGERGNRRHRPGRAFERTSYRFDVLTDYGAFRDLQRHRLLTLDWQTLSPRHGYNIPEAVAEAGAADDWRGVMDACASLYDAIAGSVGPAVAAYSIPMAYRVRFYMEMNAREAMHVIELRTAPQGHPAYRRVCQKMHALVRSAAGHAAIADAMSFVDHSEVALERLEAERRIEAKRQQAANE